MNPSECPKGDECPMKPCVAGSPTPMMAAAGLSFGDVEVFARKSVKLLRENGDTFLDMIEGCFKAYRALTGRNFIGVFAAINETHGNVVKLIDAINAEFGFSD